MPDPSLWKPVETSWRTDGRLTLGIAVVLLIGAIIGAFASNAWVWDALG